MGNAFDPDANARQAGGAEPAAADARMRLNIGLTAHRDLVHAQEPALREAVRVFLENLRAQYPSLPLRLISALAEGGDQLVAEEALNLGIELMAPLPMPQAEYERDFTDPATLARFRTLLARAQVRVLPLAPGNSAAGIAARGPARNRQYAQLGMFVSSHCQLLLALWDGHPSHATGGTAQVVDFHLHDVMPDFGIHEAAPNLLADDESDLIYHVSVSRRLQDGREPRLPPLSTRWLTLNGESETTAQLPEPYRTVFGQLETFNVDAARHADTIAATRSTLFAGELPSTPPPRIALLDQQLRAADWLAMHFQKQVRRSLFWTHFVAALMGLSFIFYSDIATDRWCLASFLTLFFIALVLHHIGERRQWQRKYLDYRGLAEGLRVQIYWRLADVETPPNSSLGYDGFLQKQDVDLSWIRHAMRGSGLLRDEGFAADARWLRWTIAHWIGDASGKGGQLEYFRQGTTRREHAHHRTARLGRAALSAGLLGAAVLLVGGDHLPGPVQQALVVTMGLLPLLAGIREAYSYKRADRELIKQFRFMRRLFESCRERLTLARSEAEQRQLLTSLGRACLEEHAEWMLLHRERPLEHAQLAG
ncbi:MAG: hypothetical protein JSS44_04335 [Proteobacteria bacterium]|nr:hypothetical protein [Pseudomonadota bacterium]